MRSVPGNQPDLFLAEEIEYLRLAPGEIKEVAN
jgi:hypothetical protein